MDGLAILGNWLVAAVPLLMIVGILTSQVGLRLWPTRTGAFIGLTFGTAWLLALVALVVVISNGPIAFSLLSLSLNDRPTVVLGFLADRLSLVVVLLVILVSAVVHLYSLRAMQEERRFPRYFFLLGLVTTEVVLVVLSSNVLMLGVFWILKGFSLTFLLTHYRERKASWRAAIYKLRVDLLGDGAIIVALVLTWQLFGTFDIQTINRVATQNPETLSGWPITLMTSLFLVAAMAKSAQFPLHRWLPQSVEAPTPVSALMHAGLINAGGFLLIRLSPLFVAAPVTMGLVVVVGGFTAFYGTLIMLTRNDVKGMLVYSTMGQMGFMLLECGLGAFALAVLHIVAHGLFKANLFLNSGGVIEEKNVRQHLAQAGHPPAGSQSAGQFWLVNGLVALLLFGIPLALNFPINSSTLLLVFAWLTLSYALPGLDQLPLSRLLPSLAGFVLLYSLGVHSVELFFRPVVAAALPITPLWWLVICVVVGGLGLFATSLARQGQRPAWLERFFERLYVRLLFTGYSR